MTNCAISHQYRNVVKTPELSRKKYRENAKRAREKVKIFLPLNLAQDLP